MQGFAGFTQFRARAQECDTHFAANRNLCLTHGGQNAKLPWTKRAARRKHFAPNRQIFARAADVDAGCGSLAKGDF